MQTLRQLCQQYESSDSVSERERLEEEIEKIARNYLNTLYRVSLKYEIESIFSMSDFQDDKGFLSFDYFTEENAMFIYEDSWSYGGSCKESFPIKFDEIDSFNEENLEKESIKQARDQLKGKVARAKRALETAQLNLEKFNQENLCKTSKKN